MLCKIYSFYLCSRHINIEKSMNIVILYQCTIKQTEVCARTRARARACVCVCVCVCKKTKSSYF